MSKFSPVLMEVSIPKRTPDSALEPFRPLLGKVPDGEIARQAGVSRSLVLSWRQRLKVDPYQGYKFGFRRDTEPAGNKTPPERASTPAPAKAPKPPFRGRRSALDPFQDILGKVPDADVAAKAGVTVENVRTYRVRRGILAEWKAQAEPAAPEVTEEKKNTPPPPPPSSSAKAVFAVTVAHGEEGTKAVFALIADDLAGAAAQAPALITARMPDATIRAVQYVADLLTE